MRKFLDGRILEVPLIVLQYYKKPSFLYIYIYKEGPSEGQKDHKFVNFYLQI
jgi:hypothetical protein